MTRNEQRWKLDGLGRVIERWDTVNQGAGLYYYELRKVEYWSFVDHVVNSTPTSVTHRAAIDETGSVIRYAEDTTQLDGHGRPKRKIISTFGAMPAPVTSYQYRNDGTLASVSVPNPSANDASTVTYTYSFDSLGRPTGMRRPDANNAADRSGVDMTYNGLVTTSREVVGAAGGVAAATETQSDAFGRLVTVKELTDGSTQAWATTTYGYGPDDNVAQIVDPEQVTTRLVHDRAGRRVEIDRGTRKWSYEYDVNGNLTSETTPCSPQPTCKALYTTTLSYDDLDRLQWKHLAQRTLSAPDRDLFGAEWELSTYDYGPNTMGRLSQWFAFGVSAQTNNDWNFTHWLGYDPQGHRTMNQNSFRSAGYDTRREVSSSFHLGGALSQRRYRDYANGGGRETLTQYGYDFRGLVSDVSISTDSGITWPHPPTVETRNVAGLVTKRRTQNLTGSMSFIESNWTYDTLGRVTSQAVQKGPGPTTVVRQDLNYFGSDDPHTLDHWLGSNHKQFEYSYDNRHQLIHVTTPADPSYFTAVYNYGPAGRFHDAQESASGAPGTNVLPRHVLYQYAAEDPEQVTGLQDIDTGLPIRSYEYDLAGNQTLSCSGQIFLGACQGEALEYLYDGNDQLRRVTKRAATGGVIGSEEYWYNSDAQRSITLKRDGAGNGTELVWVIDDTEWHLDPTGNTTKAYSHVSQGTPVARVERTSDAAVKVEYQFHGLASNTIAAVDQMTGTVNASFSYAPFGEIIEATDGGGFAAGIEKHRRRMNDKYVDELSDLAYYGFRYYDKTSMTWTQSDPLYRFAPEVAWTQPRRGNLYSFSLHNPLRYLDPDGRDSETCKQEAPPESGGASPAKCTTGTTGSEQAVKAADARATVPGKEDEEHEYVQYDTGVQVGDVALILSGKAFTGAVILAGATIGKIHDVATGAANGTDDELVGAGCVAGAACGASRGCAGKGCAGKAEKEAGKDAKTLLPDSYWTSKKAPTQITPGTRTVNEVEKASSAGGTYHSTTHYDPYGRQIGQTHRTNHGRGDHPTPHHHRRNPATGEQLKDPRSGSRTWPGLFGN